MKTQQIHLFTASDVHPDRTVHPVIEFSILAGKDTQIKPTKLTKDAMRTIINIYNGYNFALHSWKRTYDEISDYVFEPLVDEVPEPQPSEGVLYHLPLKEFGAVKLLVVGQKFKDREILLAR